MFCLSSGAVAACYGTHDCILYAISLAYVGAGVQRLTTSGYRVVLSARSLMTAERPVAQRNGLRGEVITDIEISVIQSCHNLWCAGIGPLCVVDPFAAECGQGDRLVLQPVMPLGVEHRPAYARRQRRLVRFLPQ
jgi:hypothetical protein